ncbi:universal stress protein [Marivivens aquimaris]|uniref:universal stress protein n=1 Tax=Marivivens aquimaris TaxID=2774876 RepID=UPI001880208E|nr:universal stress protein [Marivivens aquimaris]
MFQKIVVPVDLAHTGSLTKTLGVAAELAQKYQSTVCFVSVTSTTPSSIAHSPEEFGQKLDAFAAEQAAAHGITATAHTVVDHDPSVQMDKKLEKAVEELGADLVVMATHIPNVTDYIWSGHGAHLAAHSAASVLLVRD